MARNDQRRRRVVIDGALNDEVAEPRVPTESVARKCRSSSETTADPYDRRASRIFHPRTTDFIPKRPWAVALLVLAVFAVVGLINACYFLTQDAPAEVAQRFALVGTGTLSSWCSSLLMLACCLASLQIYAIRQHRQDDYQGTYRIWLLFAGILLLASLHCVVDLGGFLRTMWGGESPGVHRFWGNGITLLAIGGIFFRGLVEVRASRGTLTLVCTAWVIYVLAVMMQLPQVESKLVEVGLDRTEVVLGNSLWIGHSLLLIALAVYARNLYLTSNGLLTVAVPKDKKKKSASRDSVTKNSQRTATKRKGTKSTTNKSPTTNRPNKSETTEAADGENEELAFQNKDREPKTQLGRSTSEKTNPTTTTNSSGPLGDKLKQVVAAQSAKKDDAPSDTDDHLRLSKSERRRLRKQQAANRRAA